MDAIHNMFILQVMQVALGDKENGSSMACTNGLYKEVRMNTGIH